MKIVSRKTYGFTVSMSFKKTVERLQLHYKCRNSAYPKNPNIIRFGVPDEKVLWDVSWPEYKPVPFTAECVKNALWADPFLNEPSFHPVWNALDGNVNRRSYNNLYNVLNGLPLNPIGRTGISERGCLGRWGPNHAADPILTCWKRNAKSEIQYDHETGKPILQFVAILRKDCKEWAIPGGMVDPGETVSATLKREFLEESLNYMLDDEDEKKKKEKLIEEFFTEGTEIYKGYVDDPRNTDNAWMETVATNFHDENGKFVDKLHLNAGDDASSVKWIDISSKLNLYANHMEFIAQVAKIRNCHW